jgi:hypothetical protein
MQRQAAAHAPGPDPAALVPGIRQPDVIGAIGLAVDPLPAATPEDDS